MSSLREWSKVCLEFRVLKNFRCSLHGCFCLDIPLVPSLNHQQKFKRILTFPAFWTKWATSEVQKMNLILTVGNLLFVGIFNWSVVGDPVGSGDPALWDLEIWPRVVFVQHTSAVSLNRHSPLKDIALKRNIFCVKPFRWEVAKCICLNMSQMGKLLYTVLLEHDLATPGCSILNLLEQGSASKPSPQAIGWYQANYGYDYMDMTNRYCRHAG